MVLLVAFKTFEMVVIVSLTHLGSSITSRENLVESLTILLGLLIKVATLPLD